MKRRPRETEERWKTDTHPESKLRGVDMKLAKSGNPPKQLAQSLQMK